jgi:Tol biopolymer transport system component
MTAMRRIAGLTAIALLGAAPLAAQYFQGGQNKVQYQAFDFRIIQTEHFEIYYYPAERAASLDAARMAERWYARLSRILHHQFQGRKPIIIYASQSDFQQTNTTPEEPPEGVVAFTEPYKHRMVIPFTGSYADFEHVLGHEMVHQFQFDVFSRGRIGAGIQTMVNVAPPLWFMEGMAEYLSVGPIDPHTSMWLRDASLEGHLPTIEEMTTQNIFPYYFGHAIWAYIGEKWGDEAIGQVLQLTLSSGVEGAFKRALGITLDDLSSEWRDAIQTTYLPQLADHYRARRIAQPVLTEKRSEGTLHIAPALTPDGHEIAYFSEKNSFFVDLYLADAETGKVIRRLIKSTWSSNYESLRFINSAGAFSPDGRYFAIAVKHNDRDDLVILDVKKDREANRIRVPLNGVTTPAWSPDGKQLVFTGYDGGITDLFVINTDGSNLRRLTNDKNADLHPSWSPDGKTIAFATDRGPATNFHDLKFSNLRIALLHLDNGKIDVLDHMDEGKNVNPVWAPDGRSLAFVSDRNGISDIYLYDFTDRNIYQLTDVFTGVSGFTPLSPVLSWAHEADRLAFAYYEDGEYNVYAVDNPRSLKRQPYRAPATPPVTSLLAAQRRLLNGPPAPVATTAAADAAPDARASTSVYRSPTGFRSSGTTQPSDSSGPGAISVKSLIDSSPVLPDTSEFTFKPYHTRFTPDYVGRPTIGYERDNFGRGFFGGTAISLSDILGNHTLVFAGSINGRLAEAQVLAAYVNQEHRLNWVVGGSQEPYYFYLPTAFQNTTNGFIQTNQLIRFVIRDAFGQSIYPFSRFTRLELGGHFSNIGLDTLKQDLLFNTAAPGCHPLACFAGALDDPYTVSGGSITYYGPTVALVHDKALWGYVGPIAGSRFRLDVAPNFGDWRFTSGYADWRRYLFARPFTLAVRGLFMGRFGRDGDLFPAFLGNTEFMRGYTAGSILDNECLQSNTNSQGPSGCQQLDQLIGSRLAVVNAELRFPLTRSLVLGFLPVGFPPIEGALFYDAGVAWDSKSIVKLTWTRDANEAQNVRTPVRSWGGSVRVNVLGFVVLRVDYTKPLSRPHNNPYWTVSLGPTF